MPQFLPPDFSSNSARSAAARRDGKPSPGLWLLATALLFFVAPAYAANYVWDTNTTTANAQDGPGTWITGGSNWYDETTPLQNQVWSPGNTAVFGAGANGGTVTVSGTVSANGMIFRSVGTAASTAYTFNGGTIALDSGSTIQIFDNATNLASRLNINSTLSGNNISVNKVAGSVLALSTWTSANSLTGTLTLTSGDSAGLFLQSNTIAGFGTALVSVGANVTVALNAGGTWTNAFSIIGTGAGNRGAVRVDVNNTTLTGAITLTGNATITQNVNALNTLINSNIGESGGSYMLTLTTTGGAGVVALGGANTFTGGLTIDVANVRLDNVDALNSTTPNLVSFAATAVNKALSLNGRSVTVAGLASSGGAGTITTRNANATAATLTINSALTAAYAGTLADGTGGGALSLVKSGAGTQTLSGIVSLTGGLTMNAGTLTLSGVNTYTGGTTVNGGTLNVNNASALGATAGTVTINGGTFGNTSGTSIINANNNALVINADFTANLASSLNFGTGAVSLGTAAGTTRSITTSGANGVLTIGGAISNGTTATELTKLGTGVLILGGNSTYTGVTTVTQGFLRLTNGGALGSTAGNTTVANGARLQLDNNITVTGEALFTPHLENVGGSNTWAGTIQGIFGAQVTFESSSVSGNLLISGNVNSADTTGQTHTTNLIGAGNGEISGTLTGVGILNKSGTGTWTLSGNNTYATPTSVNAGGLQIGKNGVGNSGTGTFSVLANAWVLGTGTIRASTFTLNSNATLYAGDGITATSHGTLTFTPTAGGAYALNAGSKIILDAAAATVSDSTFGGNTEIGSAGYNAWVDSVSGVGNHDRLVFNGTSGTLTFSSTLTLLSDAYTPRFGDAFNLLDWSNLLTADFSGFNPGANRDGAGDDLTQFNLPDISSSGLLWDVSRFTTSGVIVVIPEPSRALLLLLALSAIAFRRRR